MSPVELLHCFAVSERPRSMIKFVRGFVEDLYGCYVISLALSASAYGSCLFYGARSLLQLFRAWRCPDWVIVAHSDTPVTHAAARVCDGNFAKCLFSLFILERVEPGNCAIELSLGFWLTGDPEVDLPELF